MKLPEHFVKTNLQKSKGCMIFGVPIEDMTRDELIACAVSGWQGQDMQRQEHARQLNVLAGFKR